MSPPSEPPPSRPPRRLAWTNTKANVLPRPDGVPSVRSLTEADIDVAFQPIVELETGRVYGHEALVRCKVPAYASPPILFQHAVGEGACGRLGRTIRDVAFARCPDSHLFVNIHPAELSSRWLVRPDDPICFHSAGVFLEITESATIEYYDLCMGMLSEVTARTGAFLAIDDLGSGYSNLKRIVDLEPALVKLDLSLARGMDKHRRQRTLVTQLVRLCTELEAHVVIEGLETPDELSAARDTGAHYGQGYFLARPGPDPFPVSAEMFAP